jgi:hypothetical protein
MTQVISEDAKAAAIESLLMHAQLTPPQLRHCKSDKISPQDLREALEQGLALLVQRIRIYPDDFGCWQQVTHLPFKTWLDYEAANLRVESLQEVYPELSIGFSVYRNPEFDENYGFFWEERITNTVIYTVTWTSGNKEPT